MNRLAINDKEMKEINYQELMDKVINKFPNLRINKYDSVALKEHKLSCIEFKITLLEIERE